MPTAFKGQKYSSIKNDCLKKGILFEDPEFPASTKSLFYSKVDSEVEWKRPRELCKVPKLVVEGVTSDDLNQGELGNCWFVTACASLAQEKVLFQTVVPNIKEQEWDEKSDKPTYAGIFHFQFWRFGQWIDVVIDDRLPTKNDKLIFCHSKARNEFWSALVEKAYAKLYGDYESLRTGRAADALVDFTGGVAETLQLSKLSLNEPDAKVAFFRKLRDALDNRALLTCNIDCPREQIGTVANQGLIKGHGYTVNKVLNIQVDKGLQGAVGSGELMMIRLSNPWGTKEWTGPWSDGAPEWQKVNQSEWQKLGLKFEREGEFWFKKDQDMIFSAITGCELSRARGWGAWMAFDDFVKNFTNVDISHFVNTTFFAIKKSWHESIFHSEWSIGRSGGSEINSTTFLSNPQFMFDIGGQQDKIMVSLEQHDFSHGEQGQKLNKIGFQIMKVEENRRYKVHINGEVTFKSDYIQSRSIFGTTELKKGRYVLIPTTKDPGDTGEFMLRLYTGSSASGKELTEECPTVKCPCSKNPELVTTITVVSADGLELPEKQKNKSLNPYVKIVCEGEKVVSEAIPTTRKPIWNIKGTFYRKKPDQPIIVEIWNSNVLIDDYIAEARIKDHGTEDGETKKYDLFGKGKQKDQIMPGTLSIIIRSSHDLQYL